MTYRNKYYLMLCELHYYVKHGKTQDSNPNIDGHYIVFDRYVPNTWNYFASLEEFVEFDTDDEYSSDDEDIYFHNMSVINIYDDIRDLNMYYSTLNYNILERTHKKHPIIRNYFNIVKKSNYIKPEIGEYIILPTQESIAILKTFWIRIIQRKWKKVFMQRKSIISERCSLFNLSNKELTGKWNTHCSNLPGLKGMLYTLKTNN